MRTIALRFGEQFAPECGTIAAHKSIIDKNGYVWYGKLGSAVSLKVINDILNNEQPRILLIRSGKVERYWAYISEIKHKSTEPDAIPEYYREMADKFKTWFKVVKIEKAERDVMRKCIVSSSGVVLGEASKHSMSPYFIIDYHG